MSRGALLLTKGVEDTCVYQVNKIPDKDAYTLAYYEEWGKKKEETWSGEQYREALEEGRLQKEW